MTRSLAAVYEKGVLKPTAPLDLPEGSHVELYLVQSGAEGSRDVSSPANVLASIADLPLEPGPEFAAREHDRVLYGDGRKCR